MDETVLLYTTWPDADSAERAAQALVEERLAACANILPAMRSVYRWERAVEKAAETPMLLKTTAAAAARLRERVVALHPYETPCIVGLRIEPGASHPAFLARVAAQTAPGG